MSGPLEPGAAAGRDRIRAGYADRERVIEALKDAFVYGRLTRDELGVRAGQALIARTCAELAALTTDIPAEPGVVPASVHTGPVRPPRPSRPLARAAARSGGCLAVAFGAVQLIYLADPGSAAGSIPRALMGALFLVALAAMVTALVSLGSAAVSASIWVTPARPAPICGPSRGRRRPDEGRPVTRAGPSR
jgi:hypothetical protein